MSIKNEVKLLCARRGVTLTKLAEELGKELNKTYTLGNLSKKLTYGSIRYTEIELIAEILDYNINFTEKITLLLLCLPAFGVKLQISDIKF